MPCSASKRSLAALHFSASLTATGTIWVEVGETGRPAAAAIRHLKSSSWERERHQDRAARVKAVLNSVGLPVMDTPTHIVPVMVGEPDKCKAASDLLLSEHGIYIQPINYPTVPKGTERLRITPSPYHDDALIDVLAEALVDVWQKLGLPLKARSLAAE